MKYLALPTDDPQRQLVEQAFELIREVGPEAFGETMDFGL